jgi:hypothetical protein
MDRGKGTILRLSLPQLSLVAHADWSVDAKKRWCAFAVSDPQDRLRVAPPEQVGNSNSFLEHLETIAGPAGSILVGFDFPIGLPFQYAELARIENFLSWLPGLGYHEWSDFFRVAECVDQISLHRPFYPRKPGGASRRQLSERLGLGSNDDLLRECERAHPGRRAACPLFWTLGGQQVGKAALNGWKDILIPALTRPSREGDNTFRPAAVWPFSGELDTLLLKRYVVIVETYPAELYARLGVEFSPSRAGRRSGKRVQAERANNAYGLLSWSDRAGLSLDPALRKQIQEGFGPASSGEDRFDAVTGLFGMLAVLFEWERFSEPGAGRIREIEGWIFGQDYR